MNSMKARIADIEISGVLKRAIDSGIFDPGIDTSAIFYDLDFFDERVQDLIRLFPDNSLHAIAIKANPLLNILQRLSILKVGSEAASHPELQLAIDAGFSPNCIVFDSPCKTENELRYAIEKGVHINADSLDELERIDKLLKATESKSTFGIRINPQVGTGAIKSTSVAGDISKFGVPIETNRKNLIKAFHKYSWLKGVHLHIGSQGMPVDLLTKGVRKVMDLVLEINRKYDNPEGSQRISVFDMGGGLAISYRKDREALSMKDYREALENEVPELFNGNFTIITEFGRYIHTNTAWAVSRVEYVKKETGYNIIMSHLGADFMLRECYNPQDWHHEISVLDSKGNLKDVSQTEMYFIAGPLCFAGDVIGHDIELPVVEEGDYIIIHDVGAYTLSMWSRYNSRQVPVVLGYKSGGKEFEALKLREEINEVIDFWK